MVSSLSSVVDAMLFDTFSSQGTLDLVSYRELIALLLLGVVLELW